MVVCFVLFFCLGFVDCSRKLVTCFVKSFTNGCIDDSTAYTYTCCSTASEVFCDFAPACSIHKDVLFQFCSPVFLLYLPVIALGLIEVEFGKKRNLFY